MPNTQTRTPKSQKTENRNPRLQGSKQIANLNVCRISGEGRARAAGEAAEGEAAEF